MIVLSLYESRSVKKGEREKRKTRRREWESRKVSAPEFFARLAKPLKTIPIPFALRSCSTYKIQR